MVYYKYGGHRESIYEKKVSKIHEQIYFNSIHNSLTFSMMNIKLIPGVYDGAASTLPASSGGIIVHVIFVCLLWITVKICAQIAFKETPLALIIRDQGKPALCDDVALLCKRRAGPEMALALITHQCHRDREHATRIRPLCVLKLHYSIKEERNPTWTVRALTTPL